MRNQDDYARIAAAGGVKLALQVDESNATLDSFVRLAGQVVDAKLLEMQTHWRKTGKQSFECKQAYSEHNNALRCMMLLQRLASQTRAKRERAATRAANEDYEAHLRRLQGGGK